MEIKLLSEKHNGEQKFIGFASIQVHNLMPKACKKLNSDHTERTQENARLQTINEESEGSLVDVDRLEKDLGLLQKKKDDEYRIKAEENFGVQATTLKRVTVPSEFPGAKNLSMMETQLEDMFSKFQEDFKMLSDYEYVKKLEQERDN